MSDKYKTDTHDSESGEDAAAETGTEGSVDAVVDDATLGTVDAEALLVLKEKAESSDRFRDELLRVKADFDNYQKRVRRERPGWEAHAVRGFVADLLPVLDSFERALESTESSESAAGIKEGVVLIHQMLRKALEDNKVTEIDALGSQFDPDLHEAVGEEAVTDRETGEIIDVQQKGYLYKKILVRPSRVRIARKVEPTGEEQDPEQN